jgi:hypothetical protein
MTWMSCWFVRCALPGMHAANSAFDALTRRRHFSPLRSQIRARIKVPGRGHKSVTDRRIRGTGESTERFS